MSEDIRDIITGEYDPPYKIVKNPTKEQIDAAVELMKKYRLKMLVRERRRVMADRVKASGRVTYEFCIGKYTVLQLDKLPSKAYNAYIIDGVKYNIVPIYDMPGCIAIEAPGCFIGKSLEFVMANEEGDTRS